MPWPVYLAHFFAGMFLANGVPHFVNGVSGRRFPSPFASPPGQGESRPPVNVLWGLANFLIGYGLLAGLGHFGLAPSPDALVVAAGILCMSVILAVYFGRREK